jgi:hypothetical protein
MNCPSLYLHIDRGNKSKLITRPMKASDVPAAEREKELKKET